MSRHLLPNLRAYFRPQRPMRNLVYVVSTAPSALPARPRQETLVHIDAVRETLADMLEEGQARTQLWGADCQRHREDEFDEQTGRYLGQGRYVQAAVPVTVADLLALVAAYEAPDEPPQAQLEMSTQATMPAPPSAAFRTPEPLVAEEPSSKKPSAGKSPSKTPARTRPAAVLAARGAPQVTPEATPEVAEAV